MDWLREIFSRCTAVFHSRRLDHELHEELESHIESAVEENLARGMNPEQARTAALRSFGGVTQIKESYRTRRDIPLLTSLSRDVVYAVRRLSWFAGTISGSSSRSSTSPAAGAQT